MHALQAALGIAVMVGLAWAISEDRRAFPWRSVFAGIVLQFVLALVLLKVPVVREALGLLNHAVAALQAATMAGTSFVFGYLGGGPAPFAVSAPESSFILAFQALPLLVVVSAASALLYHWRVLPAVVGALAWALQRAMRLGGPASLSCAANVFVGMIEAPLLIRPYLAAMSRADLFVVMTVGMATIAGTVLVLYATFLQGIIADPAGHLLSASIMSAPAAILIARVMVPAGAAGQIPERAALERLDRSAMEAITRGTLEGLQLLLAVVAMLVVVVALVHLANTILGLLPDIAGAPITLERALGQALAPLAWLMGIPAAEAATAGALLGVKVVLNELLAYFQMAQLPAEALSERSRLIMTYALCGFANFASLGIMIGGLATICPERRAEVVALGMRSIVSGMLATCMTGAVVGCL